MIIRSARLFFFLLIGLALPTITYGQMYTAYLTGAQENPPVATTATGYARVLLNTSTNQITFTVVFNGLSSNQTASHIHTGALGVNGTVTIDFGAVGGTSGTITGTRSITAGQITSLKSNGMYVNVHSVNNSGGEIRGQLALRRHVDFDGDGRMDMSVLRFPSAGTPRPISFWNRNTTQGTVISQTWGDALRDFPAPGDYDGDGQDDYALYRDASTLGGQSEFWILTSSTNTIMYFAWGLGNPSTTSFNPSDTPVTRDYDGDGKTDVAVARRGVNTGDPLIWYIRNSSDGSVRIQQWGITGAANNAFYDAPIPGDYDGDGKFDLAIYRFGTTPDNSFIVLRSSDGTAQYTLFGNFVTDYILPGDFDGDGKCDYAVGRTGATAGTPMVWWILQSATGTTRTQTWGFSADLPAQGDYDGDGRADIAVYRPGASAGAQGNFWVFNSLSSTSQVTPWGVNPDFAVNTFDIR